MQRIILNLQQGSRRKLFGLGLILFVAFSCLVFFTSAPSYAATLAEQKLIPASERLTPQEKVERAYEYGEAAGLIEQAKQESANANELTNPNQRGNIETATTPKAERSASDLGAKAKQLIDKVTGKD